MLHVALLLFNVYRGRYIQRHVRIIFVARTRFTAFARQLDWVTAQCWWTFVFNVLALHAHNNATLLRHRYTFTSDAVHDTEWRSKICEPGGADLPHCLAKLTFRNNWSIISACTLRFFQQEWRMPSATNQRWRCANQDGKYNEFVKKRE